ncbi:hypothetical protein B0H14DRAFT_3603991 [Mycena olivaceomarginata]|nr:hypothetical protein B0H14DRAFT_3603991 [Mycena olivaceomarginata]
MCSLLHYDNIPEAIFQKAAEWTIDDAADTQNLQQARAFLQSFLSISANWDQQAFMDILLKLQDILCLLDMLGTYFQFIHLSSCGVVYSHHEHKVQECMTDFWECQFRFTADDLLFRTGLIAHVDSLVQDPATIQEAKFLQVTVLEKQKQLFGTDHPDTLLAMGNLASTYYRFGRYPEAVPLEVTVLEKRKQSLGADHPDTLSCHGNLAATYQKWKKVFGKTILTHCVTMANLAATYVSLEDNQEAEPLGVTVLEKNRKQLFGADHPDTLLAMANWLHILPAWKSTKKLRLLDVTVLEKAKTTVWCRPSRHIAAMANLAATYCALGRYQEAEPLEVTVLEKRKQLFGADHPDTLHAMANLAATYCRLGRYQEAEPLESLS